MDVKIKEAFNILLKDYTDYFGRVTLFNKSRSNPEIGQFDSENQHLWTGEAAVLARIYRTIIGEIQYYAFKLNVASTISNTRVTDGLFSRHPIDLLPEIFHELSHDEHNGMMFYSMAMDAPAIAIELVNYGKKHNWAFIEEDPNFDPVKDFIKNPIKNIKILIKNIKEFKKTGDVQSEGESKLTRIRLPSDRALMKIAARQKVNIIEMLHMCLTMIVGLHKPTTQVSSRVMTFYKLKSIEFTGFKSMLLRLTKKYVHNKLKKDYGINYFNVLNRIYFKDVNHPFHTLSYGLDLYSGYKKIN